MLKFVIGMFVILTTVSVAQDTRFKGQEGTTVFDKQLGDLPFTRPLDRDLPPLHKFGKPKSTLDIDLRESERAKKERLKDIRERSEKERRKFYQW